MFLWLISYRQSCFVFERQENETEKYGQKFKLRPDIRSNIQSQWKPVVFNIKKAKQVKSNKM